MRFTISIIAAILAWPGGSLAADQSVVSKCSVVQKNDDPSAVCDVRLKLPGQVKRAAILANGEELKDPSFRSFEDGDDTAAWFFLIDRSNPKRAATVKRSAELVNELYAQANTRNIMAVGTFADDLRVIISPGDPYADVKSRLADIKADGAATAFFFTGIKAIDILKKVPAERKALVIISDGKAEDTAYSRDDVVKHAKEAGVVIYGVGFAEKPSETVDLQEVERLASETGGPFFSAVGNAPLPEQFVRDFRKYLTSGGQVEASLGALNGELKLVPKVTLVDGATLNGGVSAAYIAAPPAPEPAPSPPVEQPLPLIAKIYAVFEPAIAGSTDWAAENRAIAWILLLLIPLILIASIAYFVVRNLQQAAAEKYEDGGIEEPQTQAFAIDEPSTHVLHPDTLFGYFELLDSDSPRFEIRERNVTIGRHSENDFQIDDDSVHRHHAVFHMLPGQSPVITDLDTVNGVIVNGNKVDKAELVSGDVIELGETRFRFLAA